MKKYAFTLILLLCGFSFNLFSQESDLEKFEAAETMVDNSNYEGAVELFKELLKKEPMNANLNFKVGYCYLESALQKELAIGYLEMATQDMSDDYDPSSFSEKKAPTEALLYLARAYHVNYRFDEAITTFTELKNKINDNGSDLAKEIDRGIQMSQNGIELIKKPVNMNITNLGSSVNSQYDEHSPVFSADESVLIFTTKRGINPEDKKSDDDQYFEDIFISHKTGDVWASPTSIGTNINSEGHEATIGLSVDGQELFIYRDDKGDGNIYMSRLDGDVWSVPEKLPEPVNTKYRETHASLSSDGTKLYFTSDRKGGFGGLDIYVIRRLPDGKWGQAQNLGPNVNSEFDEDGPYIHPDNVTLFFSSQGHTSMGGFDIFYSYNEDNGWTKAANIGYPINSTEDDVFYVPTPDGQRAYYASHQSGGIGKNDLYLIEVPGSQTKPLTVMTGIVSYFDGREPENIAITLTDLESNETAGVYTPNSKTGKFLFILSPEKKYNIFVEGDDNLTYTENLLVPAKTSYQEIKKAIQLQQIVLGAPKKIFYINFQKGKADIDESAEVMIANIAEMLKDNPDKIMNLTFADGTNINLNDLRKRAVVNDITSKGIQQSRIIEDNTDPDIAGDLINVVIVGDPADILASNNLNSDQQFKVEFEKGKAEIKTISMKSVDQVTELLKQNPDMVVEISGDKIPALEDLSAKRKMTLTGTLTKKGIDQSRIIEPGSDKGQNKKIIKIEMIGDPDDIYLIADKNYALKFDAGKTDLNQSTKDILDKVADLLKSDPSIYFSISSDKIAGLENLTDQRKKAVIDYLVNKGIDKSRLTDKPDGNKKIINLDITGTNDDLTALNNNNNNVSHNDSDVYQNSAGDFTVNEILFDFDKHMTAGYTADLDNLAKYMLANSMAVIELDGHADQQGDAGYNMQLSLKRANFIKDYLVNKGVNTNNIITKSFGETTPISIDLNPQTRKYNRRVEIKIVKEGNSRLIINKIQVPDNYKIKH
ncbi:MAG: hypothetical protein A2W91_04075 [Bacteroidetes bacterium GWF2_38_335]|nr:MAG: hypothetical protein A2W91_04075 [Bacteroidetes bacterium GWF2_38_335]OFY79128.1 MAG: hypothetical protein A2281_03410 [Bacteroidetes bacterium RIFOXYA12_FULL_38_20]HBS88785.1 hypothetical protein [Bacteroidales bacterium]